MAKLFYGLIGFPLAQSFSPGYFSAKFQREGIDGSYAAYPLESIGQLPQLLNNHPELNGLNVTIPYKTSVIPFLDALSDEAQSIGAVNCIDIRNGQRTGHNTDWAGFRDSLKPLLQPHHRRALILGSGGSAKAVAYALRMLGIEYGIASRGSLNGPFISYESITPAVLEGYPLLINTTPLGMYPDTDRSPALPYEAITAKHLLFDLIYNPVETLFLKLGRERGAAVKNGLEMLHLQAERSWDIWSA